jgi:hypothetical protein
MKTITTKRIVYVFFPILSFFGCVENEMSEVDPPKDAEKVIGIDFTSPAWQAKLPKITFNEIHFSEPDYDSLFTVNLSTAEALEFLGTVDNTGNESVLTLLQRKIGSSSPKIKSYFENVDEQSLKDLIDPTHIVDQGLDRFFQELFSIGALGLVLPSFQDNYKRMEHNTEWNKDHFSTVNNQRQMRIMSNDFPETCEEEVDFNRTGLRKGLSFWREQSIVNVYEHYMPLFIEANNRYIQRGELIDRLYKDRVALLGILVEQAMALASKAGYHDTAAGPRNQLYKLGAVYAFFVRTQMKVWYEKAKKLNDILFDQEMQMLLDERQAKLDEIDPVFSLKLTILNDWEEKALEDCAKTGSFTPLDLDLLFGD